MTDNSIKTTISPSVDADKGGISADVSFRLTQGDSEDGQFIASVSIHLPFDNNDHMTISELKLKAVERAKEILSIIVSQEAGS